MKKREFNKNLHSCLNKDKTLDINKIKSLPTNIKHEMVQFIIRHRGPVLLDLIPGGFNMEWMRNCGYLYQTKGQKFEFIHTVENKII